MTAKGSSRPGHPPERGPHVNEIFGFWVFGPLLLVVILAVAVVGSWLYVLLWKMPTNAIVRRVPFLRERISPYGGLPEQRDYETLEAYTEALTEELLKPTAGEIVYGIFWVILVGAWLLLLLLWVVLAISR